MFDRNKYFQFIRFSAVKTLTIPIFLHHMRVSTINVCSVILEANILERQKRNAHVEELMKQKGTKRKSKAEQPLVNLAKQIACLY